MRVYRTCCRELWRERGRGVAYLDTGRSAYELLSSNVSSSRMRVGTSGMSWLRCCRLDLSGVVEALAIDIDVLDRCVRSGVGGMLEPRPGRSMSSSPYSLPSVDCERPSTVDCWPMLVRRSLWLSPSSVSARWASWSPSTAAAHCSEMFLFCPNFTDHLLLVSQKHLLSLEDTHSYRSWTTCCSYRCRLGCLLTWA